MSVKSKPHKTSPKSRDEHIASRAKHLSQKETAGEFGVSQPTVSRRVRKQGYTDLGKG